MKKIIPALALLLISAMVLASASYAWFSMNTTVTATGMQVKATTADGILISNAQDGTYSVSANAVNPQGAGLLPTSTADFTTWYKANSTKSNLAKAIDSNGYVDITSGGTLSSGVWTNDGNQYYLKNSFWLKSSAEDSEVYVKVDGITVGGKNQSAKLDCTLRVAVLTGNDKFVYAPVQDNQSGQDNAKGYGASWTVISNNAEQQVTEKVTITPVEVVVYIYFEGEDAACISDNITANLDDLTVEFTISIDNSRS